MLVCGAHAADRDPEREKCMSTQQPFLIFSEHPPAIHRGFIVLGSNIVILLSQMVPSIKKIAGCVMDHVGHRRVGAGARDSSSPMVHLRVPECLNRLCV